MTAGDLASSLAGQISALVEVAASLGAQVQSVKPHGALYGDVARAGSSCAVLLEVMDDLCRPDTTLVLPARAPALSMVDAAGRPVLQEGFCDRAYAADGTLVQRDRPGSVFGDPAVAAAQALGLAVRGMATADDGTVLSLTVDTLCVHGDSPNAPAMALAVCGALGDAGIMVAAPTARRP
jgi:UPF0271 protein